MATDCVLVALFKTNAPWAALRSHWYVPTGERLVITKVDDSAPRALEIDGKPAALRYAELLGVPVDDLEFGKPNGFAAQPTALKVGREYFIRAPWKPLPDDSILFANLLEEGTELELMKMGDIGRGHALLLPGGAAAPRPESPGRPAVPLRRPHVICSYGRERPPRSGRHLAPRPLGGWNECALRNLFGVPHQHDADGPRVRGKLTDDHRGACRVGH